MSRRDRVAGAVPVEAATGFWRLGQPAGAQRTWLFSPEGQATFLLGHQYGDAVAHVEESELAHEQLVTSGYRQLFRHPFSGLTSVLVLLAVGIGAIQFGFQQWIPSNLQELGYDQSTRARFCATQR